MRMPVLFVGHGSPMNAIEENEFVTGFRNIGNEIPKPNAILCVSAHWETKGTFVTAMEWPRTIHDFGGFPPELYQVQCNIRPSLVTLRFDECVRAMTPRAWSYGLLFAGILWAALIVAWWLIMAAQTVGVEAWHDSAVPQVAFVAVSSQGTR